MVPPRQPEALSQALARVLGDENLARHLGEGALLAAMTQFTPQAHESARMAIYRELLPRAASHSISA